jgi:hypothetical protein
MDDKAKLERRDADQSTDQLTTSVASALRAPSDNHSTFRLEDFVVKHNHTRVFFFLGKMRMSCGWLSEK